MHLKYSIQIIAIFQSPHRERLWYSFCREANRDTEKPLLSYDLTTCQLLNKIGNASQVLRTHEEAGCPPCAFQHLAAYRPLIAEKLGRSGGPGHTDTGVRAASRRKAELPSLHSALFPSPSSPRYSPGPDALGS